MSTITWGYEVGSNGDAATLANCGLTSPDQIKITSGAGTMVISTADKFSGTRSLLCEALAVSGLVCHTRALPSGGTSYRWRMKWVNLPSGDVVLFRPSDSTEATQNFTVNLHGTDGKMRLYDASGTSVWLANSSHILTTGVWYEFTIYYTISATTGSLQLTVVDTSTSTTIVDSNNAGHGAWTGTNGSLNTGSAEPQLRRLGVRCNTSSFTGKAYIDDEVYTYTVTNIAPTANAGPDQTVDPYTVFTLDASLSSDPDGTIAAYHWTQTGGTTAALSSATAVHPTATAPPKVGGDTLTYQLVVTDNSGADSTPDSVVIHVLPHTNWRLETGSPTPMRVVAL
jgi:hypothetical protein